MASYTIAVSAGATSAHDKTLVASTADTITFDQNIGMVEVLTDGTAAVYFTIDGTVATVSGAHCFKIPAPGTSTSITVSFGDPFSIVSLISSGTPVYSVSRAA